MPSAFRSLRWEIVISAGDVPSVFAGTSLSVPTLSVELVPWRTVLVVGSGGSISLTMVWGTPTSFIYFHIYHPFGYSSPCFTTGRAGDLKETSHLVASWAKAESVKQFGMRV